MNADRVLAILRIIQIGCLVVLAICLFSLYLSHHVYVSATECKLLFDHAWLHYDFYPDDYDQFKIDSDLAIQCVEDYQQTWQFKTWDLLFNWFDEE